MPYAGVMSFASKQVSLGPVKFFCKTALNVGCKTHNIFSQRHFHSLKKEYRFSVLLKIYFLCACKKRKPTYEITLFKRKLLTLKLIPHSKNKLLTQKQITLN